jgi:hypothetical protein
VKTRGFAVLVGCVALTCAAPVHAWTTILEDDFTSIDSSVWTVWSTSSGTVTASGGVADVNSGGGPAGGGTSLSSVATFDLSQGPIAVEMRCAVQTSPFQQFDATIFGFVEGYSYVAFYPRETGINGVDRALYKEVCLGNDYAGILDSGDNSMDGFHTYRLEISGNGVTFFVDGSQAGQTACLAMPTQPFRLVFNHVCPGTSRHLYVDWVRVQTEGAAASERAHWGVTKSKYR